jgi:hypothetical protein
MMNSTLVLFPFSSLPPPLPTFHPTCQMLDWAKICRRMLKLDNAGFEAEADAISNALEKVQEFMCASQKAGGFS